METLATQWSVWVYSAAWIMLQRARLVLGHGNVCRLSTISLSFRQILSVWDEALTSHSSSFSFRVVINNSPPASTSLSNTSRMTVFLWRYEKLLLHLISDVSRLYSWWPEINVDFVRICKSWIRWVSTFQIPVHSNGHNFSRTSRSIITIIWLPNAHTFYFIKWDGQGGKVRPILLCLPYC